MVARIQIRRDTSANWTSTNPTLSAGELGYETNTDKFKIGDGATTWSNLDYVIYDPSFSDILNKPTTVAGYGITDALTSVAFSDLVNKPTTVLGYGITDALTSVAFSDLTATPNTISGYGIIDAFNGTFTALTGRPTTISGYGITDAFNGVFGSLTGKPTTISGYGITDAFDGAFGSLTGRPTTISGYGITDAFSGAFGSLTGKPTTISGYGITDAFSGQFASLTGRPTTIAGYGITDAALSASPTFTGVPIAPTAALTVNNTQLATTAFATGKVEEVIGTSNKIYFQDNAPTTFVSFDEIWLDTNAGGLYKQVAGTTVAALNSGSVSNSSSNITIPASGAADTRLVLSAGLPTGSVSIDPPLFLESFSSTGVNDPTIGTLTYHDDTTQDVNQNSFTRSSGNAFDKKVKSFTYTSEGTTNSSTSHITLTVSGVPEWQIQESHVQSKIDAIIDSAPGALDTLNELAAAINDDANFASTVTASLATKAPIASPTFTGTPAGPTAGAGTNTTQLATTAFVTGAITSFSALGDFSVTSNSASGGGALSYNNTTGVFSYTPPSLAFSNISSTPTTVSGYGITDALTTGADADIGSNDFITTGKVYFANMFSQVANLPSATTYHGMFAHVHATGAAYFAHGGNWVRLANQSEVFSGAFSALTGRPTTLTGYGITDAAPIASPTFTGTPSGPTATTGTNTTQFATTAFVQSAISGFSAGANVSVSGNAPSSPSSGDLWFDDDALVLYVYYADGTSNQWVQTNPSSVDPSGFDGAFSSLSGKPTTLTGYGITDAALSNSPTLTGTPVAPTANSGTNTTQLATTAFVQQAVSLGGGSTWAEKTSGYTAAANDKLIVDTSSSAITITLPVTASLGNEIRIIDGTGNAATNNITIARNGHNIEGSAANLTIDVNRAALGLVFYNTAEGWLLTER